MNEVLSGEVQTFFKALSKRSLKLFKFAFIPTLMPNARVKYVAHRASCFHENFVSLLSILSLKLLQII